MDLLTFQIAILGLLLIASLSAIALKRIHFPYTVGLVVIGLALGLAGQAIPGMQPLTELELSHEGILFLFLPPLVFESALNLNGRLLLRNLTPVLVLAAPGLLVAMGLVAVCMAHFTALTWQEALLFGALISATDPVAVIALFKNLGVPNQLIVLVEGESLFNDATAIVTFNLILAAAAMQTNNLVLEGGLEFFKSFLGGLVVGGLTAWGISYLMVLAQRSPLVQGTLSTVLAFGTFILAEHTLHVSGVIAVVSAGMVTSWMMSVRLRSEARAFLNEFWEYASFLANSLIFLLVGTTTVQVVQQLGNANVVLVGLGVAIAAVLLSRTLVVFSFAALLNRLHWAPPITLLEQTILVWGGLRGAVGLALALSLAPENVNRDLLVTLTLGVALFTLLIPGTTMGWLIQSLGLNKPSVLDRLETSEALIHGKQQALKALADYREQGMQYEDEIAELSDQLHQSLKKEEANFESLKTNVCQQQELDQALWLQSLALETKAYRQLYDQGLLSEIAFLHLGISVHIRRDAVLMGHLPPPLLTPKTLMSPLESHLMALIRRLAPTRHRRKQLRLTEFRQNYECDLVIDQVSRQVLQRTQQLYPHEDGKRSVCEDYYERVHQLAQERITQSSQKHPEATHQFELQIAQRVAELGKERAIATLLEEGAITEKVAAAACEQIDA